MREDMFKIIVERPRRERGRSTKSKLRYVKDGDRNRMTGKRIVTEYNGDTKWLNENLAPLKRYLHKQRGRRWDDVFSEICAHLDTGSTVKMHVREHIGDFIEVKVRKEPGGTLMATGRWGAPHPVQHWADLYVDPDDGIIKETPALRRKLRVPSRRNYWRQIRNRSPKTCHIRKISETHYLIRKNGLWYAVHLAAPALTPNGYSYSDYELYKILSAQSWYEDQSWRVTKRQQLSKKQLKARGLVNVMEDAHV